MGKSDEKKNIFGLKLLTQSFRSDRKSENGSTQEFS